MELLPLIVVGCLLGGSLVWRLLFSRAAAARRALKAVPRVTVAGAPDGRLVKLVGTLRYAEHPLLMAPISERGCALYRVVIREQKRSGGRGVWETVIDASDCQRSFWLEDHSGRALIKPVLTQVALVLDAHQQTGVFKDPTPELEAFLLEHGQETQGWLFNRNLKVEEGILEQGEQVAVMGLARWEPDPDPQAPAAGLRRRALRLVIGDPPDGPMLLSDEPKLTRAARGGGRGRAGR
jgi:hypothetical protein